MKLLYLPFLFIVFCCVIECKQENKNNTVFNQASIDTSDGILRTQGTLIQKKRVGLFNIYDKNEIKETEYYSNDTILYRWHYYKGKVIEKLNYKNQNLFESYIIDTNSYRDNLDLNQNSYNYGEPSISDGKAIYRRHCNACHYIKTGEDFYIQSGHKPKKIKSLHAKNKLEYKNNLVRGYPNDTASHYYMGFMSNNDIEAIIKFLNSKESLMTNP